MNLLLFLIELDLHHFLPPFSFFPPSQVAILKHYPYPPYSLVDNLFYLFIIHIHTYICISVHVYMDMHTHTSYESIFLVVK